MGKSNFRGRIKVKGVKGGRYAGKVFTLNEIDQDTGVGILEYPEQIIKRSRIIKLPKLRGRDPKKKTRKSEWTDTVSGKVFREKIFEETTDKQGVTTRVEHFKII